MDIDRKLIKNSYIPYNREALYCFCIDTMILLLGSAGFICVNAHINAPWIFGFIPFCYTVECFLNYKVSLLSKIEYRYNKYTIIRLRIAKLKIELSWSGSRSDHFNASALKKLYPKNMHVEKYRIICYDELGKKYRLRMVMSGKKWEKMLKLIERRGDTYVPITFGKLTKVVLWCDWTNEKLDKKTLFDLTQLNRMF